MIAGMLNQKLCTPEAIACTCGNDPSGPDLAKRTGIRYEPDLATLLKEADTVVLACKPQQFADLSPELAELCAGKLILSILAGTTLCRLSCKFSQARNVVRSMPNTPGQIGAGITAYCSRAVLSDEDTATVEGILGSMGEVVVVPEDDIDAVTAVSGSGPAYFFEFTAALRESAKQAGLKDDVADRLARKTLLGAALLLDQSGDDPEALRNAVTSPGGTTEAALNTFSEGDLRKLVTQAVNAARTRSIELSKL